MGSEVALKVPAGWWLLHPKGCGVVLRTKALPRGQYLYMLDDGHKVHSSKVSMWARELAELTGDKLDLYKSTDDGYGQRWAAQWS